MKIFTSEVQYEDVELVHNMAEWLLIKEEDGEIQALPKNRIVYITFEDAAEADAFAQAVWKV